MNVPELQGDCTISGTMNFVLRISKIFGVAPLQFKKVPDGWSIRVSRVYSWYGKIVTIIFSVLSILPLLASFSLNVGDFFLTRFITRRFMSIADLANAASVTIAGGWTGTNRMRYMIDSMAQLEQMNKELVRYGQPSRLNERKKWYIVMLSLIFGLITVVMDYVPFFKMIIAGEAEALLSSFHVFYAVLNITLLLVVLQLTLMITWVLLTLQLLNNGLLNLLQDTYEEKTKSSLTEVYPESILIRKNKRTVRKSAVDVLDTKVLGVKKCGLTVAVIVHRQAQLYCALCDIVRHLNDSHGPVLLFLYVSFLMHLIIVPYRLVVDIFQSEQADSFNMLTQVVWTVFHFTKLMMVTEPCHRIHQQMARTKNLINQMLRYTSLDDFTVISELKWFYRHLVLNEVSFSVWQFFTVNRSLVATIISSITTYLVIAVQFL